MVIAVGACSNIAAQDYPMKPNEEHKVLKAEVGVWDAKISMDSPDGETISSAGVETVTMLGEFWTVSTFVYDYMGQETTGHGVIGYDPSKNKYVGTWHESGSPYRSKMEGTYDAGKKQMTYLMTSRDAQGNEQNLKVVTTTVDDKHRNFEMHAKMPGSDDFVKIMLIEYTKRDK